MRSNLEIVKASYAASEAGDLDGILADITPQTRWTEMTGSSYAGTYVGREEVVANIFAHIGADWEGFQVIVDGIHDAGDAIIMEGWYAGTFKATGKKLKCRAVHVWKLADGKVASFEQFADTKLIADVMA